MEKDRYISGTADRSLIIDAHTHVKHGDRDRTEVPAERVISQMDEAGIGWSVILSICAPSNESHDRLLREWQKFPDRLIPFAHGRVLEGEAGLQEVHRAVRELGFAGVKVHFGEFVHERGRRPTFEEVRDFFAFLTDLAAPVLVDLSGAVEVGRCIADTFPKLKMIVAHLGHPRSPELIDRAIRICREHDNLWMDCSYCFVPEKIPEAIEACGSHKIIFGSDGPWDWIPVPPLIDRIRSYELPEEETAAILGGNIRQLLKDTWDFGSI